MRHVVNSEVADLRHVLNMRAEVKLAFAKIGNSSTVQQKPVSAHVQRGQYMSAK